MPVRGRHARELALALGVAVLLAEARTKAPSLLAVAVPAFLCALLLASLLRGLDDANDAERNRWLRRATALTFIAHLALSVAISSASSLVLTLGGDANTYHTVALEIVSHWNNGTPLNESFLAIGKEGFYYALAGLYWLFGSYRQSGLVVNAALAAAVVPILHDTTRRLFGREAARVSVVLYAILPGFVIWTSQLLREAAVVFLLALAANATVRLTQRTTPGAYVLLGGSLALLFTVRANVALVAAGALVVGLAVGRARVVAGFSTAMAAVGLVAVLVLAAGIGGTGYELSSRASLADISATRQALAQTAKSGIAPDKDFSTTGEAAGFLPFAMASFAFGPFPWTVNSALQVGGVLEALSLWFFFPSLVRGWRYARGSIGRRRLVLGLPALLLAIALSLLIGNYGTIVRERLQISIFLLPFVAQGWVLRPKGERSPTGIRRPQSAPLASHL